MVYRTFSLPIFRVAVISLSVVNNQVDKLFYLVYNIDYFYKFINLRLA